MGWGRVCFGAFLRCTAAEERVLGCCGMHGLCSDLSSPQADLCAQLSPFMFQTKSSSKTWTNGVPGVQEVQVALKNE